MKCTEETLYLKTADGIFHKKTFRWWTGKDYMRVYYSNTRNRVTEETEHPCSPSGGELESIVDQHLARGWETNLDVLAENVPTLDFENWPEDFRFSTMQHNPDIGRLNGKFSMWQPVRGQTMYLFISPVRVRAFDKEGKLVQVDPRVLREAAIAYPPNTILRGVYTGTHFHVWDVPFKKGEDLITFGTFADRRPTYNGRRIRTHEKADPRSSVFLLVDEEASAGIAYSTYNPSTLYGVWLCHPRQ